MADQVADTLFFPLLVCFALAAAFFLRRLHSAARTLEEAARFFNDNPDSPEAEWFFGKYPDLRRRGP